MVITGLQKLTLLDYPDHIACIVFTQGCNFKCPFCQNSTLISNRLMDSLISEQEIFDYLKKRKKILDGIVITGGEPTIQKDLKIFIKKIRELGLKVKLDTNGYNPSLLKELLDEDLIDYVAMDIKNCIEKYSITAGLNNIKLANILESIALLKKSKINYEFRTTIMKEYHSLDDIKEIINLIGNDCNYYLQNFKDSENVLDKNLHGFSEEELKEFQNILINFDRNLRIRDLDYTIDEVEEEFICIR